MAQQLMVAAAAAGQPAPSTEVSLLDLASLASVRDFVQRWEQQQRPLHVLVNNAGMFAMGGAALCGVAWQSARAGCGSTYAARPLYAPSTGLCTCLPAYLSACLPAARSTATSGNGGWS